MNTSPESSELSGSASEIQSAEVTPETVTENINPQELADQNATRAQERAALQKHLDEGKNFPSAFMRLSKSEDSGNVGAYWHALKQMANEKKLFTESDEAREKILDEIGTWFSVELRHARYGDKLQSNLELADHCDLHYLQAIIKQTHSLDQIQTAAKKAFLEQLGETEEERSQREADEDDADDDVIASSTQATVEPDPNELEATDDNPLFSYSTNENSEAALTNYSGTGSSTKERVPVQSTKVRSPITSTKTHEAAMALMRRQATKSKVAP